MRDESGAGTKLFLLLLQPAMGVGLSVFLGLQSWGHWANSAMGFRVAVTVVFAAIGLWIGGKMLGLGFFLLMIGGAMFVALVSKLTGKEFS